MEKVPKENYAVVYTLDKSSRKQYCLLLIASLFEIHFSFDQVVTRDGKLYSYIGILLQNNFAIG